MKRMVFFFGWLLSLLPLRAQVTLEACVRLARKNYPEIRKYDLIGLSEKYDLSNAARAWLPQVSFSAQATWQNEVPRFPEPFSEMLSGMGVSMPGLRNDQYKVAMEVTQAVWDGGKSRADRLVSRAEAETDRLSSDVVLYEIEARVNDLYFGILLMEEQLVQTDLTMGLLNGNLERIRSMMRNGVAMQSDADAIEAELVACRQRRGQISASIDSYREMLALFVGAPLQGELVRPEVEEPVRWESARPELSLFRAQSSLLSAQELSVKSLSCPRVGLFFQGYYGYPGMDYFASMMSARWRWNALVGIRFSWNLGGYYTQKNRLGKLEIARNQVEIQRDVFLFNTDLSLSRQRGNIVRLRRALEDDDRIVSLRKSVREASESKLENGIIDMNELLRTITDEASARSARSAHEIELLKTICELKHTING